MNGVDIHERFGAGWAFDGAMLSLAGAADGAVISGTNLSDAVSVSIDAEIEVTFSNACINAAGMTSLVVNAESVIRGMGINVFKSGTCGIGGLDCPFTVTGGTFVVDAPMNDKRIAVRGGSLKLDHQHCTMYSDFSAGELAFCVPVSPFTPGSRVLITGQPGYYNADELYADDEGGVYLWLPSSDWHVDGTESNNGILHSPRPSLTAAPAVHNSIVANGYMYDVAISPDGSVASATRGEALSAESLKINSFSVEDGAIRMNVTAEPATWLAGFFEDVTLRAAEALPIPDADETRLDLSGARRIVEPDGSATYIIALPPSANATPASMFFKVETSVK